MPTQTFKRSYQADVTYVDDADVRHLVSYERKLIDASDTKSGVGNSGWRRQVELGINATTNFTGVRLKVQSDPGEQSYFFYNPNFQRTQNDMWYGTGMKDFLYFPAHDASLVSTAGNRALIKVLSAVREAQVQLSGPTFLGELRETVHMIRSPAKALRGGISDYLSTLKKRARGPSSAKRRILADTWLEFSFGWKPFFHDIADGVKAYQQVMRRNTAYVVRGSGKAESATTSGSLAGPNFTGIVNNHYEKVLNEATTRYIVGLWQHCYGPDQSLESVSRSFGFVPREWAPTAWELLPWSFLVDYFVNIGDVIQATATSTADVTWICRTDRQDSRLICSYGWTDQAFMASHIAGVKGTGCKMLYATGSTGSSATRRTTVNRSKPASLGIPTLAFKMPGLSTQWINMAALGAAHRKMVPYYR